MIGEDFSPFAEGLVGGDEHGSALVSRADQFEQNARLRLVLGDIGEIVKDQQMIFVEFGDRGFEGKIAACDLKLLHKVGGPCEQNAPTPFDQRQTERRREMGFPGAGRPEAQQIGSLFEPGVAGGERLHLRLRDHRHSGEVERVEGLSRRQSRFVQMPFEAAAVSLHHLLFGEGCKEAGGGPAFLVGCRRQGGPDQLDAGQSQFAEQQVDAGGVDLFVRLHAASPTLVAI